MLETKALDAMAEHFRAHNEYPRGTVHLAAKRLAGNSVWEKTLDTDNGRKTAKRILAGAAMIGSAAMMIVPGGTVVSAGLLVVTSGAGIASVGLELEGRLSQGQLQFDRRLAMDVLQVAAIALPFGTLTKTLAAAQPVAKTAFALCMTGIDVAQGFLISADVKRQLSVIDASTAVQLAEAGQDEQRKAIYSERDRRVAEVLGGAVVNGGFLLVSLGGGIKHTVTGVHDGAAFKVRDPVRDPATTGHEPFEHTHSADPFEYEGQHVSLSPNEPNILQSQLDEHKPSHTEIDPSEQGNTPAQNKVVGIENRGLPYADPREEPALPHEHLDRRQLRTYEKMDPVTSWKKVERAFHKNKSCAIGRKIKSVEEGHEILQRLAAGDARALEAIGMTDIPPEMDTSLREWALVQGRDGLAVYVGQYGSVTVPSDVRLLAHNHPSPRKGGSAEGTTRDLPNIENGHSYADLISDPDVAKDTGITPSIADIHAISDGEKHVIYTRYVSLGDGRIVNPTEVLRAPRVALHLTDTKVLRWNDRIGDYWYEVTMTVMDSLGRILWSGKIFGLWHSIPRMGSVHLSKPSLLERPLSVGWKEP